MRSSFFSTLACCACLVANAAPESNTALSAIKELDQADRQSGPSKIDWASVNKRDEERRAKVMQILRDGGIRTDADYYNAALVFQHGPSVDDIRLAHALSLTASQMNPQNRAALWLSAASWDRLLMRLNRPQWYATQFVKDGERWVLYQVDVSAVNDEERVRVGARTLEDAKDFANHLNAVAK
jgi:hypothetical protein